MRPNEGGGAQSKGGDGVGGGGGLCCRGIGTITTTMFPALASAQQGARDNTIATAADAHHWPHG